MAIRIIREVIAEHPVIEIVLALTLRVSERRRFVMNEPSSS